MDDLQPTEQKNESRQATTPQDAAAGLTLLQQTLLGSQPYCPRVSQQHEGTGQMDQQCHPSWASFSVPALDRMQRKAARRAAKMLHVTGISTPKMPLLSHTGNLYTPSSGHSHTPVGSYVVKQKEFAPSYQHEMGSYIPVPVAVTPKTYPYMHSSVGIVGQASPKASHPEPPLTGSQFCSAACRPPPPLLWQEKPRVDTKVYATKESNTSGGMIRSPSPSSSLPDSGAGCPLTSQEVCSQHISGSGGFHGCAVTRNSLGSVIPSVEVLPCAPYIPPKCPETLTEAACMYIDYLIQENENLVHISHCELLQPFTRKEHTQFIQEVTQGPCQMPSDKFRAWLKQFNVDVEVVNGDIQEGNEGEEELEDFDASMFLHDLNCESQNKEQHVLSNLSQIMQNLISEKQADGSLIIQCLPEHLAANQEQKGVVGDPRPQNSQPVAQVVEPSSSRHQACCSHNTFPSS